MVAQRVYGLALGYDDLSDHDQLREDPLLAVLGGKARAGEEPLACKSTLNRLELGGEKPSRYKKIRCCQEAFDDLLIQVTELERAQATTIRLRLLKIGAQIRITVRKVWLSMASSYPLQQLFGQVHQNLRPAVALGG
jgi:hypothetical protein